MRLVASILVALGLGSFVHAVNHDVLYENTIMASLGLNPDGTPINEESAILLKRDNGNAAFVKADTVELPLNHFGASPGTFKNRFWINEDGYKPGAPIFIYDAGEGNAEGSTTMLTSVQSSFAALTKKFGGMGILWEHRYYGKSTPVTINTNTSATDMQWLTSEQALADVSAFAWNFTRTSFPGKDLTPAAVPWVFVGGSYPGMRAAFMRQKYPGTVFASWASSAPVQASIDMSFYFEPVWQGMNAYGYGNCTQDVGAAVRKIDEILADEKAGTALKKKFLGDGGETNSNAALADALSTIFWQWQSYGMDGNAGNLRQFCDYISTDVETKQTSPAQGWAATKGAQYVIDKWASWGSFIDIVNTSLDVNCRGPPGVQKNATRLAMSPNCNLAQQFASPDAISWTWQYCTQWGYFQAANVGPHQLLSKYNDLFHQKDVCQTQFPDGKSTGLLPEWPLVDKTNKDFGGWDIRPSNTFWTGSQFDPWRTLSPLSDMPFSNKIQPNNAITACAAPGEEKKTDYLFSYLVPNGQHCYDMRMNVPQGAPARTLFMDALSKWLSCWKPGTKNEYEAKVVSVRDNDNDEDADSDSD